MDVNTAWFAGLFEGEGTIGFGSSGYPRIQIGMHGRDLDILQRCKDITAVGRLSGPYTTKTGSVVFWTVTKMPDVWEVLVKILPLLGSRRQEKANEILDFIRKSKTFERHEDRFYANQSS